MSDTPTEPSAFQDVRRETRLDAKDVRVLLLWILAGLIGAGVAFKYFFVAFPEASVDFRVSRPAAVEAARSFLVAHGQKLEGYESSIVFRVDENTKTYLEREVGLEQANRLMASEVSAWSWDVRFFRPQQQEEFRVEVAPSGGIVGMKHVIEEVRAGASLEREAARARAEEFLRGRIKVDLKAYDFLPEEANSNERPKRRDWSFTWERRGFKAKDAPYRLRVGLQGDAVDSYNEFLKVPEAWERDFQRLRSSNILYQYAAQVPYAFLLGGVFLVLYDLGRRGLVKWGGALKLGFILAALFFAMEANQWPLTRANYDTNSSYAGFFFNQMTLAALVSLVLGMLVALSVGAGEPLYRADHPQKLRLGAAFSLRSWRTGIRSKEFFRSCVIGLSMAGAHIGFVVAFYLVGKNFGFWSPQDIKYTDTVSTALPWIYPLAISIYAATSEEFLFRLFAIPLLLRLTKSKWVAVIVPAFIWGFLHSAYPQQPGYVRGIEVGIIGVVAGWVMLRWGIVTTLVWHYTVDALLIGLILLRSESLYFRLSGMLVVALSLFPFLLAVGSYLTRREFAAEESLFNRAEPLVAPPETEPEIAEAGVAAAPVKGYPALSRNALGLLLAVGALGALVVVGVKSDAIGTFVRFSLNAGQATERANGILRGRNVDPGRYRHAATVDESFSGVTNEYLRREIGVAAANKLYQEKVPSAFWRVRYFRDSEKEEYNVILRADGGLHSVHHSLDEKTPGANLTKEEAQARAEAWLREEKKLDLAQWKLVEAKSDKRPARTDHTFVWEEIQTIGSPQGQPLDSAQGAQKEFAHVRTEIKVLGDEVSGYRVFVKLPEEWERKHTEERLGATVYKVGRIVFFVAWGVAVLVVFFMNLRQQKVPWARMSRWALWGALALFIIVGNTVPKQLAAYPTEFPFKIFVALVLMTDFILLAALYSMLFFAFGLAWFFLARAFGEQRLPSWRGMPADYYRDALVLALSGAGVMALLSRLRPLVDRLWPTPKLEVGVELPGSLDVLLPAAGDIASSVMASFLLVAVVALTAGWVTHLGRWGAEAGVTSAKGRALQAGFFLLLALALTGLWGSPADFVKSFLLEAVSLSVIWLGVTRLLRFNLLAYFLLGMPTLLIGSAAQLLRQPSDFYRYNGYAVIAALLLFLAWPLVAWQRSSAEPPSFSQ